jgi:hypothetical protein
MEHNNNKSGWYPFIGFAIGGAISAAWSYEEKESTMAAVISLIVVGGFGAGIGLMMMKSEEKIARIDK